MSCVSRGPANQAVYFLKYFHPPATPKCAAKYAAKPDCGTNP